MTLMDRVHEAYWDDSEPGTDAALKRVVRLVLDEAAGMSAIEANACAKRARDEPDLYRYWFGGSESATVLSAQLFALKEQIK